MKKLMNYGLVVAAVVVGLFTACDDGDEATLNATACFNYSPTEELIAGTEITFTSCSENATIFAWDFGDGHISTEENPKHTYETGGDFIVKIIATNEISADTTSQKITILPSEEIDKETLLIGLWRYVYTDENNKEWPYELNFYADNKVTFYTSESGNTYEIGTWSLDGNMVTITNEDGSGTGTINSDNTLTIAIGSMGSQTWTKVE